MHMCGVNGNSVVNIGTVTRLNHRCCITCFISSQLTNEIIPWVTVGIVTDILNKLHLTAETIATTPGAWQE
jgi:hypothetical protein